MSEHSTPTRYALPIMLGVLGLSILVFFIALSRYLSNQQPSNQSLLLASTPSLASVSIEAGLVNVTPSTTPRPSWSPPPSSTITLTRTITPSLTPTRISTLTPANPQTFNFRYRLTDWSQLSAERLIELVSVRADSEQSEDWYAAASYTRQEALLQYPQSLDASHWRWQLAHYQLLAGDSQTLYTYASLILTALQTRQVRIEELSSWFNRNAPELTLSTTPLPTQPGELNRLLLHIRGAGNGFLWLINTPGSVQVTPLLDRFDPIHDAQAFALTADLTGDGQPELIIYETAYPTQTQFPEPWIFDLSQQPPSLMPIQFNLPFELGTESERSITFQTNSLGGSQLLLTANMFSACPVQLTRSFEWDGEQFTISAPQVQIQPDPDLLAWCDLAVDHASLEWAPELTLAIAEPLLTFWPPQADNQGKPYPADALDAWRFRLGVLKALTGQQTEAIQMFQTILDNPSLPQSSWIEPARAFITAYQRPEDLYRACQAAPGCNMHHAIQTMVRDSGITAPTLARQYLLQNGVAGRFSGYFDFDGDGTDEPWLLLRPLPDSKLEFWVLVATHTGVQAIFVQVFESNTPLPRLHDTEEMPPVVQLELGRGFILVRDPQTREAAIHFVDVEYSRPTFIRDRLDNATKALFSGIDPAYVLGELLSIHSSPRFAGDCIAYGICARFYYTLGLAYQLTGNQLSAIDWYLTTWREYPQSPYTLMARLKLELIPATPTWTPTITRIPTITNTPDPNRTSTPTTMPYGGPLYTPTQGIYP